MEVKIQTVLIKACHFQNVSGDSDNILCVYKGITSLNTFRQEQQSILITKHINL